MRFLSLLPVLVALPLGGCIVKTSSDNEPAAQSPPPLDTVYKTDQVWPSMSAQSDGTSLKVYAAILSNSTFLKLDTGEAFTAQVGSGDPVVLTLEPYTDGKVHYTATFPANTDPADVTIAFHRAPGFDPAPASKVTVPAAFSIASTPPASIKLGSTLSIKVSPAPAASTATTTDRWTVSVSGDCLISAPTLGLTFDDEGTGSAALDPRTVQLKQGASGCDVGVQVRHETRGASDPAFQNASTNAVEGLQARGFSAALIP